MKNKTPISWKNWFIVVLILLNLSTFASIFYHNRQNRVVPETAVPEQEVSPINGACMSGKLKFTSSQDAEFKEINRKFKAGIGPILLRLDEEKREMFSELQKVETDIQRLESISENIGRLHRELKQETYRFYLSVKALCTPAQHQELQQCFTPLFDKGGCSSSEDCQETGCGGQKII